MESANQKIPTSIRPAEPSAGLFDRIIRAIKQEQEFRHTKKIFFTFFGLLIISLAAAPFSFTIFIEQITKSGFMQFVSITFSHLGNFIIYWKDFGLAILESIPVTGLIIFTINVVLLAFVLRLFLYKKQFLFKYFMHNFRKFN